jgi:hypothetical protein
MSRRQTGGHANRVEERLVKPVKLRPQRLSGQQERNDHRRNRGDVLDEVADACIEPGRAHDPDLQAEGAQLTAQVILDVVHLALQELARGQEEAPLLAGRGLDVHRLEQAHPHHLRDPESIVAIGLVDPGRQGGVHVTGLDADRRETRLDQPGVEPGRERTSLKADPAEGKPPVEQVLADHCGLALDRGAMTGS